MKKSNLTMILMYISYLIFLPLPFFVNGLGNKNAVAIVIGSAISVIVPSFILFILPEKVAEKRSELLKIKITKITYFYYFVQLAVSVLFTVMYYSGIPSPAPIIVIDAILFILTVLSMVLKAPKENDNLPKMIENNYGKDELKPYVNYLRGLAKKSKSPALSESLLKLADCYEIIDPSLSQGIDILETETGAKCVAVEAAVSADDGVKQALLTKDINELLRKAELKFETFDFVKEGEPFDVPRNDIAESHIDKILDQFDIEYEEDIVSIGKNPENDIRFIIAKKLADNEYRAILEDYGNIINEKITEGEQKKAENVKKTESLLSRLNVIGIAVITVIIALVYALWAFIIAPGGYSYKMLKDESGNQYSVVTNYNTIYGNDVKIPSEIHGKKVKVIATNAFSFKNSINSIMIPEGVEVIENEAMKNIYNLKFVYLPKSLRQIGYFAIHKNETEANYRLKVYYAGSEEEYKAIDINRNGNASLIGGTNPADVTYNYKYR